VDVTLFMVTASCTLQWTATAAAIGPSSLVIWVLGGLAMFLPLSVCVVFLSSRYPDEGGLYAWSARAFGPFAGFMAGWTYWTGTLAFLPSVLYFTAGSALLSSIHSDVGSATPAYFVGFSLAVLAVSVALNVRGISCREMAQQCGRGGPLARDSIVGYPGRDELVAFRSCDAHQPANPHPTFRLADVIFWTTLAFCWTGAGGRVVHESRNSRSAANRAQGSVIAAPMIAAIYIMATTSILISIPAERASGLYGVVESIRAAAGPPRALVARPGGCGLRSIRSDRQRLSLDRRVGTNSDLGGTGPLPASQFPPRFTQARNSCSRHLDPGHPGCDPGGPRAERLVGA